MSARPLYLQRRLDTEVGQGGFEKFDVAVTRKVWDIAGLEGEQLRADLTSCVDCLRGLPEYLSGGTMQHARWSSNRDTAATTRGSGRRGGTCGQPGQAHEDAKGDEEY